MGYERKSKDIQAIKLVEAIFDSEGYRLANQGDWLVIEGRNQFYMTNTEFHEEFQKKEDLVPIEIGPFCPRDCIGKGWWKCQPMITPNIWVSPSYEMPFNSEEWKIICDGTTEEDFINNTNGINFCTANCVYEARN